MKLKWSSNVGEEEEATNIAWNGKDTQSPRQHGKTNQPFLTMVTWFNNTKTDINHRNWLVNKQRNQRRRKTIKIVEETIFYEMNIPLKNNMSTTAAAQPVLTVLKDEFTKVITEGTLSPTNKPTDWNVVITEKALLEAMRTPSSPPKKIWHGQATLYDNTFPTHKEYWEFMVNHLTMWGNTLDYKLFNTPYMTHQYHAHTIKKLREQAMALLEEANKINKRDMVVRQEIESHVWAISRSNLWQWWYACRCPRGV
jgi:hypothetical protein